MHAFAQSSTQTRLAACSLVRTRFPGRAAMEREAERSTVALARLEVRLGLADESAVVAAERSDAVRDLHRVVADAYHCFAGARWGTESPVAHAAVAYLLAGDDHEAREAFAARCYATSPTVGRYGTVGDQVAERSTITARLAAPRQCRAIDAIRSARRVLAEVTDPIATRPLRWAESQACRRVAAAVIREASLRKAEHAHTRSIEIVEPGEEGASSAQSTMWARDAGMSAAYCRHTYRVATSEHRWRVSRAILSPGVRALNAAAGSEVYLSPVCRVVNGRGTSLKVQVLTARGAWK